MWHGFLKVLLFCITAMASFLYFCRRPSITEKHIFFIDSQAPISPFSMMKYALWTLSHGYNIEKGRGGRNVKIRDWKTHSFNGSVSTTFVHDCSSLYRLSNFSESVNLCKFTTWYPDHANDVSRTPQKFKQRCSLYTYIYGNSEAPAAQGAAKWSPILI